MDNEETEQAAEPAEVKARLRARRRERKTAREQMPVSGRSVLLLKRLREARAHKRAASSRKRAR